MHAREALRRRPLDQLAKDYGEQRLADALNAAQQHSARDSRAYAEQSLFAAHGPKLTRREQANQEREPVLNNHAVCDLCQCSLFLNDLTPMDGMAACNDCRKKRQQNERPGPLTLRLMPPNEAQRAWDKGHAEIEARYQQRLEELRTPEVWARWKARLRELFAEGRGGKPKDAVQAKIDEQRIYHMAKLDACPEWAQLDQLHWLELRKLGLRPLRHWDELEFETPEGATVRWTPTGKRVAAYWAAQERATA